jgi:hypothetical protein
MTSRRWIPTLLLFFSVGCTSWKLAPPATAAVHPSSAPPASAAKICVVRTSVLAQAVTFPTHDNGVLVGATRGPTHFCYLAEPGEHEIAIEADELEKAKLTAEAGKSYFLKQEVDYILGYVKCRGVWLAESEAKDLFENSAYEVLVGVPGSESLPPNPPYAPARKLASSK